MASIEIAELLGDGIGPELEQSVATVAQALPVELEFRKVDWSLETREREGDAAIDAGVAAIEATRVALKYPTMTATHSPNALLRRRCNFSVIYRPAVTIPGIASNFSKNVNLHIVRVATGGTYEDPGQPIGQDAAVSIRLVERGPCEHAAAFAFQLARRHGWSVTSASKHTIQRVTDGLFKRSARARLLRDDVVQYDGILGSLKRFKDDVREVREGFECGMSIDGYNDIRQGDIIEAYEVEEVARSL